jgi:hypothetical protein
MFETFCALLLRIYPSEFRRAYGREAVQLIRDRARDERGVFLRLRLLMDLAIDLFATVPPDNPYPVKGWEVIGIEPDVKALRTEAFEVARRLAESRARRPMIRSGSVR